MSGIPTCPKCNSEIRAEDVYLGRSRAVNICPHCGAQIRQTRKSAIWFGIITLTAGLAAIGVTAIIYDAYFGTPGHGFISQGKAMALESMPAIFIFVYVAVKFWYKKLKFELVEPST